MVKGSLSEIKDEGSKVLFHIEMKCGKASWGGQDCQIKRPKLKKCQTCGTGVIKGGPMGGLAPLLSLLMIDI